MRVQAYWNSHKQVWSIRHDGKVIAHEQTFFLHNCKFIVQKGGRERVLREKNKNIHAWVEGDYTPSDASEFDTYTGVEVKYNPYKGDKFRAGGEPLETAGIVFMSVQGTAGDPKKRALVMLPEKH